MRGPSDDHDQGPGRPELEWTFTEPSSSGDLAIDLPAIFLNSLRTGASGQDGRARMSGFRRVLQEAERGDGASDGGLGGRAAVEEIKRSERSEVGERGEREERDERDGGMGPLRGAQVREGQEREATGAQPNAPSEHAERSDPRGVSASQASDPTDPTAPRHASMPEDVRSMCCTVVTRIVNLVRAVERRAMEGLALSEESTEDVPDCRNHTGIAQLALPSQRLIR